MIRLKSLKNGGLHFDLFTTSFGWSCLIRGSAGVRRYFLPWEKKDCLLSRLKEEFGRVTVGKSSEPSEIIRDIKGYFNGENPNFYKYPLDVTPITSFQQKVCKIAQTIPYGQTRTYSWISRMLKSPHSQRAVGGALAANPFPLFIPCHRVIRSNGTMGGFSAGSGVALKEKMLQLESDSIF